MEMVCGDQWVDVSTVRRWEGEVCSEEMVCGDQCVDVSTVRRWVR